MRFLFTLNLDCFSCVVCLCLVLMCTGAEKIKILCGIASYIIFVRCVIFLIGGNGQIITLLYLAISMHT